jgi:hypothetical protein
MRPWRIALTLGVWLAVAGCAPGPSPVHSDQSEPIHGESGGGGSM